MFICLVVSKNHLRELNLIYLCSINQIQVDTIAYGTSQVQLHNICIIIIIILLES
jgi:hypothetical protein